jgi:hypothetical protein
MRKHFEASRKTVRIRRLPDRYEAAGERPGLFSRIV